MATARKRQGRSRLLLGEGRRPDSAALEQSHVEILVENDGIVRRLAVLRGDTFGFAGTVFADDDVPAELDPNTESSQQALLKPCPPLVLPTVTVTVFLPDNEPGACENPQAETFETCLALLATYFGQTLTREQAAQCLPAIPEGFDAGTDPIAESGVQTPPNHDEGRIDPTDSDACAAPPSGRPGVHAPTIDLFKVKIKFGSGSEVDVEVGPPVSDTSASSSRS